MVVVTTGAMTAEVVSTGAMTEVVVTKDVVPLNLVTTGGMTIPHNVRAVMAATTAAVVPPSVT